MLVCIRCFSGIKHETKLAFQWTFSTQTKERSNHDVHTGHNSIWVMQRPVNFFVPIAWCHAQSCQSECENGMWYHAQTSRRKKYVIHIFLLSFQKVCRITIFFFSVCCPSVMSLQPLFEWSQLQLSYKFTTVSI